MKILNLAAKNGVYSCNVYLVLGSWNALRDVNTLVDVGRDPSLFERLDQASTGVGKKRVEQVILTHSHYDHAANLPQVRERYSPVVHAFSASLEGVDSLLENGERLRMGDGIFEVLHVPGHSYDSVCLYCPEEGVLFSGDTTLQIQSLGGSYEMGYILGLEKLCRRDIQAVYPGHGDPILRNYNEVLCHTLRNVLCSMRKEDPSLAQIWENFDPRKECP